MTTSAIDFRTHPTHYRHWRLEIEARQPTLTYELSIPGAGLIERLPAEDELVRPRCRHRASGRGAAAAVRAPRGPGPGVKAAPTRCSAPAPTSGCSPTSTRSLQGQLLQVHERDPGGDGGCRARSRVCEGGRVDGTAAGGGYELALACDEILLIDDKASAVSLPEVPLLGVLPGTGGLTPSWTSGTCVAILPTPSRRGRKACVLADHARTLEASSTTSPRPAVGTIWYTNAQPCVVQRAIDRSDAWESS